MKESNRVRFQNKEKLTSRRNYWNNGLSNGYLPKISSGETTKMSYVVLDVLIISLLLTCVIFTIQMDHNVL